MSKFTSGGGVRRGGLSLLIASVVLAGLLVVERTPPGASADDLEITGTVYASDEAIAIDDGSGPYRVVSAIHLSPFLGRTVSLQGSLEGATLYARVLTLGAATLADQGGRITFRATETVEKTTDGFQVTVDGIAFTVIGSPELDQVAGQIADIEGELAGTLITLTSVVTADGEVLEIQEPVLDDGTDEFIGERDTFNEVDD